MATEVAKTDQVANAEAPAVTKEAEKVVEADKPKEDTKKEETPQAQGDFNYTFC